MIVYCYICEVYILNWRTDNGHSAAIYLDAKFGFGRDELINIIIHVETRAQILSSLFIKCFHQETALVDLKKGIPAKGNKQKNGRKKATKSCLNFKKMPFV